MFANVDLTKSKKLFPIIFSHIKTCTTLHCQSLRWRQKRQYSQSCQSPGVSKTNSYLRMTPKTLPKVLKLFNLGILTCCRIPYLWGYEVRNTCEARVQLLLSLGITVQRCLKTVSFEYDEKHDVWAKAKGLEWLWHNIKDLILSEHNPMAHDNSNYKDNEDNDDDCNLLLAKIMIVIF